MTEVTTNATEAANAAQKPAPTAKKSPLNQHNVQELEKGRKIGNAAQKPAYAAKLAEHGVTGETVTALLANVELCGGTAKSAAISTRTRKAATKQEAASRQAMLNGVRSIQTGAIRKHRGNQEALGNYYLSQRLDDANRATLAQIVPAVLEAAARDELPGITAAMLASVQTHFDAWIAADDEQTTAQSDATTQRTDRDALLKEIIAARIDIQLAADVLWPHTLKKNAAVRRVFQLPADRPFRP